MAATQHGVLTANQVLAVTIDVGLGGFVVVNRSLEDAIWVTYDGTDPVVAGPGSYVVLGAREFPLPRVQVQNGVLIKLLASSALAYTVEAVAE